MLALRALLIGSALIATAASAATSFTPLGARPGLWQFTVQMTGAPPIPASTMAHIPPAQRAQMLANMQKPVVTKQCLTAEQLRRGFDVGAHEQHCTRTVLASTGSGFSMHMECKTPRGTLIAGTFQLALVDATHFRGSSAMTMTIDGKPGNMGSNVVGQWVSADCGTVKPREVE